MTSALPLSIFRNSDYTMAHRIAGVSTIQRKRAFLDPRSKKYCPDFAPGFLPNYDQCQLAFCLSLEKNLTPKQIWLAVNGIPEKNFPPFAMNIEEYYSIGGFEGDGEHMNDVYRRWRHEYVRIQQMDDNYNDLPQLPEDQIPKFERNAYGDSTSRRLFSEYRLGLLKAMEKTTDQRARLCTLLFHNNPDSSRQLMIDLHDAYSISYMRWNNQTYFDDPYNLTPGLQTARAQNMSFKTLKPQYKLFM